MRFRAVCFCRMRFYGAKNRLYIFLGQKSFLFRFCGLQSISGAQQSICVSIVSKHIENCFRVLDKNRFGFDFGVKNRFPAQQKPGTVGSNNAATEK